MTYLEPELIDFDLPNFTIAVEIKDDRERFGSCRVKVISAK